MNVCGLRPPRLRLFLTQQCTQSLTDTNAAHLQRQPGTAGHNPDRRADTFLSESLINMPLGWVRGDPVNFRQREDHQGVIPRGHECWQRDTGTSAGRVSLLGVEDVSVGPRKGHGAWPRPAGPPG